MSSNNSNSSLALTPLGAGDLIDRAVRFYRKNFWTFVWIAAPPILLGTLISIGWTMFGKYFLNVGRTGENEILSTLYTGFGTLLIFFLQTVLMLTVMGGASRNFVRHLLFGESITFKETYSNVVARFFGLLSASTIIIFGLGFIGIIIFYFGIIIGFLLIGVVSLVLHSIPPLLVVVGIILGAITLFGTGWIFFLIASRFAYVPQIMLVEGQSVFSAMGRSTSLASGNVMRIYSLFIFTSLATASAVLLFYIPLNWYAYAGGIEVMPWDIDAPAWYAIANQIIQQASFILLAPILMIGLCLLYVDERVRHEGYDIELMAARNLGEIPSAPGQYANPLQPALAAETFVNSSESANSSMTTLGLK